MHFCASKFALTAHLTCRKMQRNTQRGKKICRMRGGSNQICTLMKIHPSERVLCFFVRTLSTQLYLLSGSTRT